MKDRLLVVAASGEMLRGARMFHTKLRVMDAESEREIGARITVSVATDFMLSPAAQGIWRHDCKWHGVLEFFYGSWSGGFARVMLVFTIDGK